MDFFEEIILRSSQHSIVKELRITGVTSTADVRLLVCSTVGVVDAVRSSTNGSFLRNRK